MQISPKFRSCVGDHRSVTPRMGSFVSSPPQVDISPDSFPLWSHSKLKPSQTFKGHTREEKNEQVNIYRHSRFSVWVSGVLHTLSAYKMRAQLAQSRSLASGAPSFLCQLCTAQTLRKWQEQKVKTVPNGWEELRTGEDYIGRSIGQNMCGLGGEGRNAGVHTDAKSSDSAAFLKSDQLSKFRWVRIDLSSQSSNSEDSLEKAIPFEIWIFGTFLKVTILKNWLIYKRSSCDFHFEATKILESFYPIWRQIIWSFSEVLKLQFSQNWFF